MYKGCQNNRCIIDTQNKIIVLEENKRRFIAQNDNQNTITVYCIDGCLIKNELACDFGLKSDTLFCFIELKGKNIIHAFKQLNATIENFQNQSMISKQKIKAFIVPTKNSIPKLKSDPAYLKLVKQIGKNNIEIKSKQLEIKI